MAKTYKIVNNISLPIIENFFILRENRNNLRNNSTKDRKTVRYELVTMKNRTSFLWANLTN